MGRATVISGGQDGLYSVKADFGKPRVDALVAKLQTTESEDIALAEQKQTELDQAQTLLDAAVSEIDVAIQSYKAALESDDDAQIKAAFDHITALLTDAEDLRGKVQIARFESDKAKAKLIGTRKKLAEVIAIESEKTLAAWCVDYTEDAAGEVATIEIPGEPAKIVIAPSGRAPTDADGFLLARGIMSPEQAFFNAAILPGWQKFKPTFRIATITSIDYEADTCSIALDAAQSSAQSLPINQANTINAVPVDYMTCNASAFESGDRVVVEFLGQNFNNPKVIGFESNPKQCEAIACFSLRMRLSVRAQITNQASGGGQAQYTTSGGSVVQISPDDYTRRRVHRVFVLGGEYCYLIPPRDFANIETGADVPSFGEGGRLVVPGSDVFAAKQFGVSSWFAALGGAISASGDYPDQMPSPIFPERFFVETPIVSQDPLIRSVNLIADSGTTFEPWGYSGINGIDKDSITSNSVVLEINTKTSTASDVTAETEINIDADSSGYDFKNALFWNGSSGSDHRIVLSGNPSGLSEGEVLLSTMPSLTIDGVTKIPVEFVAVIPESSRLAWTVNTDIASRFQDGDVYHDQVAWLAVKYRRA